MSGIVRCQPCLLCANAIAAFLSYSSIIFFQIGSVTNWLTIDGSPAKTDILLYQEYVDAMSPTIYKGVLDGEETICCRPSGCSNALFTMQLCPVGSNINSWMKILWEGGQMVT